MTVESPPSAGFASRRRIGPPGLLFYAVTLVAVLLAVDANTRKSFGTVLIVAPIWFVLAATWLVRLLIAGNRARWRLPAGHWVRWLLIPLVMATVFFITRTDVLVDARLNLSRDAMDGMAADVMAGGTTERGWVGLYNVGTVDLTENGFRFAVDDSGLYRWGFAYSLAGAPSFVADEEEEAGLWVGATLESIGGRWWRWSQGWD